MTRGTVTENWARRNHPLWYREAGRENGSIYGWAHGEFQPRLTIRQAGASGTLRVAVKLSLKA